MLGKKVRKKYYEYYESFEIIQKEIQNYMYNNDLFLKENDKNKFKNKYIKYIEEIKSLIEKTKHNNFEKQDYTRMFNQLIETIKHDLNDIDNIFQELFKNSLEKFYYCKLAKNKTYKIHKKIIISLNMFSGFTSYKFNYPIKDLKKITTEDLKFADVILSQKSEKNLKKNPFQRLISIVTTSPIGHSALFLENKNNKAIYLDVADNQITIENFFKNPEKIKYIKTNNKYSKDVIGLVLRIKSGLSKTEKNKIEEYIENHINLQYGFFKVLLGLLAAKLYEQIPINKFKLKNPNQNLKSMFFSELVSKAYEFAGIQIRNKSDPAETSPSDLLNSPQLEIIGYIEK